MRLAICVLVREVVGVGHPCLIALPVDCVEDPQGLSPDVRVVSIQHDLDVLVPAVRLPRVHQVIRGVHSLQVLHVGDPFSGEAALLQKLLGLLQVSVVGGVVQEDDVEVGVVLDEQRSHGLLVSVVVDVVVAGHNDTEGQLSVFVERCMVDLVVLNELSLGKGVVERQVIQLFVLDSL